MNRYTVCTDQPTVEDYLGLRIAVGWSEADREAIQRSIEHSLYWVLVRDTESVIGCGRVIGDGGLCFYVQDIIVHPVYQGQGLGRQIMECVMSYLREYACHGAFVGLMAAKGMEKFYLKYGFISRPTEDYGAGMILFWP